MTSLKEVTGFLDKNSADDFVGSFILLSDSATLESNFMVHYFISQSLKDGHTVCLVSFAQVIMHYSTIAAKLGVNLSRLQQQGRFVFVDCLTQLLTDSEDCTSSTSTSISIGNPQPVHTSSATGRGIPTLTDNITLSLGKSLSLKALFDILCSVIERVKVKNNDKPICLILDDVSVLLSIGLSVTDIAGFCHYCKLFMLGETEEKLNYLVTMVNSDVDVADEEEELLLHHLVHGCHLHLHTQGLTTGYSRDVHGELTAEWRDPSAVVPFSSHPHTKSTQYKVLDRGIKLFAHGLSTNLL